MGRTAAMNVILISLDDAVAFWNYKSIFGEALQTPNLDRICAQSTAFHAAYCQAPVCSPSRASFMSGKSPHQTGVTASDKNYFDKIPPESMWPYLLKQNGYFCSSGGKVMRGFAPLPGDIHDTLYSDRRRRFKSARRKRFYDSETMPGPDKQVELGGFRGGLATVNEEEDQDYYDYQVADSAELFLGRYSRDAPFYREVGFAGTHGPWMTPLRFKEMYRVKSIQKPEAWKAGFGESAFMELNYPGNIDNSRLKFWKNSVRNYFSALTHTDLHLGRVWDAIKASPHADNTLVVILSDHRLHLGERNRFRKHTLWEQVANVPLIIHDPRRPREQVVNDPVALMDIGPTVMEYLGLPPLADCVGRSLVPQMEGESVPDRAVPTFLEQSAGIRKGKFRFIRYGDGTTQLYDLSADWWQTKELGPDHPDHAAMRAAHAACCKEYGFDVERAEKQGRP
ncbi:sulfatase-like hydrolase/transferase [Frigidibacter sp. ROC022]|uniref:sulfatase-like hydrolase/transferase n=1 Tax=Frigidibacter sp. ROC022 TaxID=2971796 RepID=UPI00215B3DCB|nr:sulfatase-like hydrolase/transferase [Frigidibacter sp. ROC022]MCR8726252.1 sulfatase-like hydrolase/transferase [Frigidibacter sp. ROC022]